jgi:hypothetical protein
VDTNIHPDTMHPAPANPNIRKKTRPKWETFKHEVQQLYLHEDKTLAETMTAIELRHGFTARSAFLQL